MVNYDFSEIVSRYEQSGLFARIIDAPAEDAAFCDISLDMANQPKRFCLDALKELDFYSCAATAIKRTRLFGGAIAVMLADDGRKLDDPLCLNAVRRVEDLRVFDASITEPILSADGSARAYRVESKYGRFTVHASRCLEFRGDQLPERSKEVSFWGIPEYNRILSALDNAEAAFHSIAKLPERISQWVYSADGLSLELAADGGEKCIMRRLEAIDRARGMLGMVVIDADSEDYTLLQADFRDVGQTVDAAKNMLSAVAEIPRRILFGESVPSKTVLAAHDNTSLEVYCNFLQTIQNRLIKSNAKKLLTTILHSGVNTGELQSIPAAFQISFAAPWSLNEIEKADAALARATAQKLRAQTAKTYYDRGLLSPAEIRRSISRE